MFGVAERTPPHAESAQPSTGFEVAGVRVSAVGALSPVVNGVL